MVQQLNHTVVSGSTLVLDFPFFHHPVSLKPVSLPIDFALSATNFFLDTIFKMMKPCHNAKHSKKLSKVLQITWCALLLESFCILSLPWNSENTDSLQSESTKMCTEHPIFRKESTQQQDLGRSLIALCRLRLGIGGKSCIHCIVSSNQSPTSKSRLTSLSCCISRESISWSGPVQ